MKKLFLLISIVIGAVACNQVDEFLDEDPEGGAPAKVKRSMDVASVVISDDCRNITVSANLVEDIPGVHIEDQKEIEVTVQELHLETGKPYLPSTQPVVKSVSQVAVEAVKKGNLHIEVLVDLCAPKPQIKLQQAAVRQIQTIFPPEYFDIAFMDESGIKGVYPATEYIVDNYFVQSTGNGMKYLYQCIATRMDAGKILVIFSDGKIYAGNYPIDPHHFDIQEAISQKCANIAETKSTLYYVNFAGKGAFNEAGNFARSLCENTGGLYQDSFDWNTLHNHLFEKYGIEHIDYRIVLENPDNKIYNGAKRKLVIECKTLDGKKIADAEAVYTSGNFYHPVVVNGRTQSEVIAQGIAISLMLALLVYLCFQLLVPRIMYAIFKRKHVAVYKHDNMSVNGILVEKECYYCKAPFVEGDEIVAACKHVMHKNCWDENGYHCPEYGRNCKTGSHYYNSSRLLDPGNASFHMIWILVSLFAGMLSWVMFSNWADDASASLLQNLMFSLLKIKPGTPEAAAFVADHIDNLSQSPSFGMFMGFLLTLVLSFMAVHKRGSLITLADTFVRAVAGSVAGFLVFLIGCCLTIFLNMSSSFVIDWIAWSLTGLAIAFIATFRTRIQLKKKVILFALGLGGISMLLWNILFVEVGVDYRIPLLFSHLVFSVGLALGIAQTSPRSERYYFHIGGAMKEMDIAIYKWFEANTNRIVTFGRSVDCDLVMSWDMTGDIAPLQANITKIHSSIYITPVEEGVYINGRNLPVGRPVRLYHGRKFTIGKTDFTYQEKDI